MTHWMTVLIVDELKNSSRSKWSATAPDLSSALAVRSSKKGMSIDSGDRSLLRPRKSTRIKGVVSSTSTVSLPCFIEERSRLHCATGKYGSAQDALNVGRCPTLAASSAREAGSGPTDRK